MKNQYGLLDLKKAFGTRDYLILDDRYKQQLANHPVVRNMFTIGHSFVLVANTNTWSTELVAGECEVVSGYTKEEIEASDANFLFNFGLVEDMEFNMAVTKLGIEYFVSSQPNERGFIFIVYFYRAKRKDGKIITIQHQSIPLCFDENNIPFIFSNIITDISYMGITRIPHAISVNRSTNEVFHISPGLLKLKKIEQIFSAREQQIIQLLVKGNNSRTIAQNLNISLDTVRTHRKNILKKAGIRSTVELLGYSLTNGMI